MVGLETVSNGKQEVDGSAGETTRFKRESRIWDTLEASYKHKDDEQDRPLKGEFLELQVTSKSKFW